MKIIQIITYVIIGILGILTLITAFNYPKQYECYQSQCTQYNIDTFHSCKHLGSEKVGFLTTEDFYLCDEQKIAKRCSKVEEVKQDIKPNLWQILTYQCTTLNYSIDKSSEQVKG